MRAVLKRRFLRVLPTPVLRQALAWRSKWIARQYRAAETHDVFAEIHRENHWGSSESRSGPGSERASTGAIVAALPRILQQYGVRSMLDAPCGDFQWMQRIDLTGVDYVGGDIVKELVDGVSRGHAAPNRRFVQLDLGRDALPPVDLIFCRDCFIHLPFKLIHQALANFRRSGAKYVLTTTFVDWPINYDTAIGGARAIDLCAWPFNLPKPLELIQEDTPSEPGAPFKCMGLWSTESL
jgi:hypothetical protein